MRKRVKILCTVALLLCVTAAVAQQPGSAKSAERPRRSAEKPKHPPAPPIALRGGKLLTISHGVIENGVILMENGKIAAVGPAATTSIPRNAHVVDTTGMTIYPGLIDSETHLGLTEITADPATNDLVEASDEIMPHMHVYDAFHAESELIPVTRMNGVTNAIVAPTSKDTLPGQDVFIQLAGRSAVEMLLVRDIALPLNFTGEQRRQSDLSEPARPVKGSMYPTTRMGMAAQLRQAFLDAQEYVSKWADYDRKKADPKAEKKAGEPATPPKRDLKLEALVPYLQGRKPLVISAEEPGDMQVAVGIAREFKLKFVLDRVNHSQAILNEIAALKAPVIVGPIYEQPKDNQRYDAVYRLPAELHKRGIPIAFASYDAHNSRNLPYAAGFAVAFGLPYDVALRAITLQAAEIWGLADRLGSLDVGKTANVVVATGDPLDVKTDVRHVYIAGREIPLESRQTRLRDEYMKK